MIIELITAPFLFLLNTVIGLLPTMEQLPNWMISFLDMVRTACVFIPVDVWILVISNVVFWFTVHFVIGLFKFIWDLLPFV